MFANVTLVFTILGAVIYSIIPKIIPNTVINPYFCQEPKVIKSKSIITIPIIIPNTAPKKVNNALINFLNILSPLSIYFYWYHNII